MPHRARLHPCQTPQPLKLMTGCTGDSSTQSTKAAMKGQPTEKQAFSSDAPAPAAKQDSTREQALHSRTNQPAAKQSRKRQTPAANTRLSTMADTSQQLTESGKPNKIIRQQGKTQRRTTQGQTMF
ncbi:Hypothetical predicted protein [Pelobates cultripes]|uniref:Uncharacterized protein n=1 Tax=Pelobates cultripes TaxID=61616 RepID=A0AAD1R6P8_PELCU|nr:Hypothetical predicted protein [Pelobates cultripes]